MATLVFATRLRRSIGPKARVALGLLAVAVVGVAWEIFRDRADGWPVRVKFELPPKSRPLGFGPDGRTFLTAGPGGLVPYDLATGRPGKAWETRSGSFVNRGTWSPDGRTYAAQVDGHPSPASFELIDASTGRTTATITTSHPLVFQVSFVDGGRSLRAILGDSAAIKEVTTWDVASGRWISSRPLTISTRGVHHALSADGRWLATMAGWTTSFQLRDLEADGPPITLSDPTRPGLFGYALEFLPDGRTLAISRAGGLLDLWDVLARKVTRTIPIHSPGYVSFHLTFARDGRTLASVGGETSGGLGMALFELYHEIRSQFRGGGVPLRQENVLVDLATGAKLGSYSSGHIPYFSPDGRSIATIGENRDQTALVIQVRDLSQAPVRKGKRP